MMSTNLMILLVVSPLKNFCDFSDISLPIDIATHQFVADEYVLEALTEMSLSGFLSMTLVKGLVILLVIFLFLLCEMPPIGRRCSRYKAELIGPSYVPAPISVWSPLQVQME